jgi:Domain of unknown function (DUF5666)
MKFRFVCCLLFLAPIACHCQDIPTPKVTGYVTDIASPSVFDVNGQHIQVTSKTKITLEQASSSHGNETSTTISPQEMHLYLGEAAEIYGEANRKTHTIAATRLSLHPRKQHDVSGFGIIDAVPPLPAGASPVTDRLVRADGYSILIGAATKLTFDKPLTSPSDINVNVWMSFHGAQRSDGVVVSDKAAFRKNIIKENEDHLRGKNEYDPSAVPDDKKQSGVSKAFKGIDPKQIPPSKDTAMQARVSAIGAKLVPKYQLNFPNTEETRINFRFQVIDSTKDTARWHDALTLPNGIILVPHQVVERLQNDSQLATVLADNIACALEKQPLASHVLGEKLTATQWAADAGGFFVPGLGLAAGIGTMSEVAHVKRVNEDQSGRVSLSLLKDAGYDVTQAPIAWWLLDSKEPKDLADIPLPRRAAYLYEFLGETSPPQ